MRLKILVNLKIFLVDQRNKMVNLSHVRKPYLTTSNCERASYRV
jgi:hypothetical protein